MTEAIAKVEFVSCLRSSPSALELPKVVWIARPEFGTQTCAPAR